MKPTWIVENFVKEPSFKELTAAAKELGYPLIELNGDFSRDIFRQKMVEANILTAGSSHFQCEFGGEDNRCMVANGSLKMCRIITEELTDLGVHPTLLPTFERYKCSAYYSYFGPYLFNDKYCMMSLKEIVRQKYEVWGHYGKDSLIFLRPDSGEKTFQAGMVDIIDLPKLWDANKDVEHELMLVSTPKNVLWEGRFVVSKSRGIIASSTYRFQGKVCIIPSVPTETTAFCKQLLQKVDYVPDPVFCLDICQDTDKNCWLMELTSFSSAGLYATDKKEIITKVSEIAIEEYRK
jgi:hypothetical protein